MRLKKLLPLISAASLIATLGGVASPPALAGARHRNHQTQYRQAEARWEGIRRTQAARRVQEVRPAELADLSIRHQR